MFVEIFPLEQRDTPSLCATHIRKNNILFNLWGSALNMKYVHLKFFFIVYHVIYKSKQNCCF